MNAKKGRGYEIRFEKDFSICTWRVKKLIKLVFAGV